MYIKLCLDKSLDLVAHECKSYCYILVRPDNMMVSDVWVFLYRQYVLSFSRYKLAMLMCAPILRVHVSPHLIMLSISSEFSLEFRVFQRHMAELNLRPPSVNSAEATSDEDWAKVLLLKKKILKNWFFLSNYVFIILKTSIILAFLFL